MSNFPSADEPMSSQERSYGSPASAAGVCTSGRAREHLFVHAAFERGRTAPLRGWAARFVPFIPVPKSRTGRSGPRLRAAPPFCPRVPFGLKGGEIRISRPSLRRFICCKVTKLVKHRVLGGCPVGLGGSRRELIAVPSPAGHSFVFKEPRHRTETLSCTSWDHLTSPQGEQPLFI